MTQSRQSTPEKLKTVLILGAGPAGLTAAYELLKSRSSLRVIVLEKSSNLGGISKTVEHHGNRMDLGGHRFFTKSPEINQLWQELLPGKLKTRTRLSHIYFNGKFFDYPISLKRQTLKNLGLKTTLKIGFSYLAAKIFPREEESLEDFYINRFGRELYSLFFENYTETVWGKHPSRLSADWGAQRVKGVSISSVLKNALTSKFKNNHHSAQTQETSLIDEFFYPDLGPGEMWTALAEKIQQMGGEIITNAYVKKIIIKNKKVKKIIYDTPSGAQTISADFVVSSLPLKKLINTFSKASSKNKEIANKLPYRDYLTIGLLIKKSPNIKITQLKDTWLYIHDSSVKLGRIQIYNNWSKKLVKDPEHTTWVGLEYFCQKSGKFWQKTDQQLAEQGIKELERLGLINSKKDILDFHVERVEKAYPAYWGSYKKLPKLRKYLNKIRNLYCIGRNGQHRYNNMDHSMLTGLLAAKHLLGGDFSKEKIWQVNTEKKYHETHKQFSQSSAQTPLQKLKTLTTSQKILIGSFPLWLIITFLTALFFHENWEDEAQAWLLARDCTLPELIARMQVEGHFLPWYLILMPFAKLGFPFKTINFINWLITAVGMGLILQHYPGKPYKKLLFLFSSAFLFWYPVVARCYCLLPLAAGLLFKFYPTRLEKPWKYLLSLVILVNVHIHTLLFAIIIGLDYLRDWLKLRPTLSKNQNRVILLTGFLAIALIILSGLPMLGSVGTVDSAAPSNVNFSIEGVTLTSALTAPFIFYAAFLADGLPAFLIYISLALFVINLLKTRPAVFWKTALSLLFQLVSMALIYPQYLPTRIFMVIFFYLFFSYTDKGAKAPAWLEIIVFAYLFLSTIQTGNLFCSIFLFVYLAATLLPPYLKKFHGINFQATLNSLARLSLVTLGILSTIVGLRTVYEEFKFNYTDSLKVARYIAVHNPDTQGFIVSDMSDGAMYVAPITLYLESLGKDYVFYNTLSKRIETYSYGHVAFSDRIDDADTPQDAEQAATIEDLRTACNNLKTNPEMVCYYLINYDPEFYDIIEKMLEASGHPTYTKKLELNGDLTLLYDSYDPADTWEQAPYEHYRLYRVN